MLSTAFIKNSAVPKKHKASNMAVPRRDNTLTKKLPALVNLK